MLARGDRRDFVILDEDARVHSLGRQIAGVKAKDLRAFMADIDPDALPGVKEARAAIRDAAVKGEEVSIPGFGKFKVQNKPARTGRNPSTGATIQIAASKKVSFQAAKALKDAL